MGVFTSYLLHFASLFFMASPMPPSADEDTLQHEAWLVTDTLDLHLAGPSYEVSFFMDGIIFLSTGQEGIGIVPLDQALLSKRRPLFSNDPKPYSPAGIAFTSDQGTCYSTRYVEIPGEFRMEKIFGMSVDSSLTSGLHQISFTLDSCRYLHPALTSDDSVMVFSSDRLPTSGGLDLFVTRLSSTGWSLPVNLGPSINSNGHELYPFLDHLNNLWFSSSGHSGYGNYDIYVCHFNGQEWERPRKLDSAINTSMDEIGFSIHRGGQLALFTRRSLSEGMAIRTLINETAIHQAGIEESLAGDISMILQNMAESPVDPITKVTPPPETEALVKADTLLEKPIAAKQDVAPDPQKVIFRVQILSNANASSTPSVVIEGEHHSTFEYYYKGAYRITVGEFETVQAANSFRLQCRRAGFSQAFVAAFRGEKRETDPSVFKN
ncbi:MAG: hypothetical protein E4H10_09475 [Bacteroidia bacterium]|nr:MAG: hypothetical protein E4H10_09475 [Bacteroidia bacterium]